MTGAKRQGFTLIEILIVTLIFAIASTILSQIFVSFNRLQRQVANSALLAQDMRFANEMIVREARNKSVNFTAYSGTEAASSTVLHLTSSAGTEDIAVQSGSVCGDVSGARCLALSTDGGTTWNPITSARVDVRRFGVYIRPTVSPFTQVNGAYPSNIQPVITFVLDMQYLGVASDSVSLVSQTSVDSRLYQR